MLPLYSINACFKASLHPHPDDCRLVQKQNVRFFIHQLTQTHLRLFPATQYTYLTFNMLGSQTAFGESRPHLILSIRRKLRPDLINTGSLVITLYFLLKISNLKISPSSQEPFRDGINPRILFSKVVLPIPFAPTSAILFPLSIERVTGLERGSL